MKALLLFVAVLVAGSGAAAAALVGVREWEAGRAKPPLDARMTKVESALKILTIRLPAPVEPETRDAPAPDQPAAEPPERAYARLEEQARALKEAVAALERKGLEASNAAVALPADALQGENAVLNPANPAALDQFKRLAGAVAEERARVVREEAEKRRRETQSNVLAWDARRRLAALKESLRLSDDQVKQIDKLNSKYQKQMDKFFDNLRKARAGEPTDEGFQMKDIGEFFRDLGATREADLAEFLAQDQVTTIIEDDRKAFEGRDSIYGAVQGWGGRGPGGGR